MKVALCLYGHFRCFAQCLPNLLANIIQPYQPDIFAMAWMDSFGHYLHPPDTDNPKSHPGFVVDNNSVQADYLTQVLNVLNPVDIHLDHYFLHDSTFAEMINRLQDYHHPWPHHRPKGTLSLNYIRKIVISMKRKQEEKQGFQYDRVICTRWDIEHPVYIDLTQHDPNLLVLPNSHGPNVTGDIWASGSSDLIDIWGQQFDGIQQLVNNGTFSLGPHEWMKSWLAYKNVPWQNRDDLGVWIRR